jgi:chloramphenicol O-acetyltransferase type A
MIEIDIDNWERKAQYNFFKDFDDPFMGVTSNIECTQMYLKAKELNESFFIHYMHKALQVINEIPEFKLRILGEKVVQYPIINGTTTVFKHDKTFNFSYFKYIKNSTDFYIQTKNAIELAKKDETLVSQPMQDLIHVSVIPWRSFTCIKHPRIFKGSDSIPKLVFGKVFKIEEKYFIPVSIDAHHALIDGYHVSTFFNKFEALLTAKHSLII